MLILDAAIQEIISTDYEEASSEPANDQTPEAWIIYIGRAETYRRIARLTERATGPMGRPKRQET
ncbi:hypothetical protein MJO28_004316 [Puccinia striiformis f. sp. tritici]|uniref:Uncharacterized protein n=1 Tax=Puccinia striiformis f. sp. tritici TaxID=168172 RepID=A0ACC0EP40_9BASI|nr:hypothetical protein MJO28_004316 [Puccinia striiformis f. sp. tritici]